jgi:hypothetical protein
MTDSSEQYKYNVAISLLAQDLDYAKELDVEIRKVVRGEVFLYMRRQEPLAIAGELVEEFTRVFRDQARVVLILFRARWGNTSYTSIEQEALRSRRTRTTSFRFALVVSLETEGPRAPEWYPASDLVMDPENFSPEAIARVVAARVEEAGGKTGPEGLAERHLRLQQEQVQREELEQRLAFEGPKQIEAEARILFGLLKQRAEELAGKGKDPLHYQERDRACSIRYRWPTLVVVWTRRWANTLEGANLSVAVRTVDPFDGGHRDERLLPEDHAVVAARFELGLDTSGVWGWRPAKKTRELRGTEFFASADLADWALGHLLQIGHQDEPPLRSVRAPRDRPGWVNGWRE